MSTLRENHRWFCLKPLPRQFSSNRGRHPYVLPINECQYIIIGPILGNSTYVIYDSLKDTHSEPIEYRMSPFWAPFDPADSINCVYSQHDKSLYILNIDNKKLAKMDINTNRMKIVADLVHCSSRVKMLMIDHHIHFLELTTHPAHHIYDFEKAKNYQVKSKCDFHSIDHIIYLKSANVY